eukprot:COSAG02_NODE_3711_length_6341_cov_4.360622_2_plen_39_part_00
MLYLERKEPEECTPIERQIKTQIELGQVRALTCRSHEQ